MTTNTKLSLEKIRHSLLKLGLEAGQIVMLHASLRSIGRVEGGPRGLLEAILGILTTKGTLMMLVGSMGAIYDIGDMPEAEKKADYFGPMVEDYLRQAGGKRGRIGQADSYMFDAQGFKQFGIFWLESNLLEPTVWC